MSTPKKGGRPKKPGGPMKRARIDCDDKEKEKFENLAKSLDLNTRETFCFLMEFYQKNKTEDTENDTELISIKYPAVIEMHSDKEKLEIEGESTINLQMCLKKSTWIQYTEYFSETYPNWAEMTHGEKLAILLEIAKRHANSERVAIEKQAPTTPEIRLGSTLQKTPTKSRIFEHISRLPPTPNKGSRSVSIDRTPTKSNLTEITATANYMDKNHKNEEIRSDPESFARFLTPQTERIHPLKFQTPIEFFNEYTEFFHLHDGSDYTHLEKLSILLLLAETDPRYSEGDQKFDLEKALNDCSQISPTRLADDRNLIKSSSTCSSKTLLILGDKQQWQLNLKVPNTLWQRYETFLKMIGLNEKSGHEKLETLLRMAKTHPYFSDNNDLDETLQSQDQEIENGSEEPPPLLDIDIDPEAAVSVEDKFYTIQLKESSRQRFTKFFDSHGWKKTRKAKRINILLDLAESHPTLTGVDREFERNQEKMELVPKTVPIETNQNYDFSEDSDASWNDTAIPKNGKAKEKPVITTEDAEITVRHKHTDDKPIPLLKPDYYLKFSEEARNKCPPDSNRTYAAMANTRRYIVEWRQLKRLIEQCSCTHYK